MAKRERERAMKDGKPEGKMSSKCGVRHVREVVTRTVTYQVAGAKGEESVRMSPAPRGKRRRLVSGVARRAGELKEEQ